MTTQAVAACIWASCPWAVTVSIATSAAGHRLRFAGTDLVITQVCSHQYSSVSGLLLIEYYLILVW
jgi:hypothetical protein